MLKPPVFTFYAALCDVCNKRAPLAHSEQQARELAEFNSWQVKENVYLCDKCAKDYKVDKIKQWWIKEKK